MRLLLLICAMVWPSGQAMAAACGTGGFLISGFDAAGSCTGVAETGLFSSSHTLVTVTSGTYTGVSFNPEGNQYGRIIFSANASQLTLTAANFPAGVGTDWSSHDFVYFAYATTRTTASAGISSSPAAAPRAAPWVTLLADVMATSLTGGWAAAEVAPRRRKVLSAGMAELLGPEHRRALRGLQAAAGRRVTNREPPGIYILWNLCAACSTGR